MSTPASVMRVSVQRCGASRRAIGEREASVGRPTTALRRWHVDAVHRQQPSNAHPLLAHLRCAGLLT
ncbi:hypothetical protein [Xanthomonas axonopodis]|uniref:Uncharacterized protein n=2 Tax=Xanthomonas axonopodis TaxID=53413 RepID=A0A098Q0K5_9XANT|nr:hypothetical protein [Xanthomonas axonopodis]KGE51522.1 hypothetical protein GW15_0214030 [Xanthomonas axonopodis pv. vasculorum]QKD86174.1 hypothetical protein XAV_06850 [Xanthomonas axonopodis pv. vasculorum]